jgi:maltooligosyltrehalose trehalohydrolase
MERLGAVPAGPDRVEFRVWAPAAEAVAVRLISGDYPLEQAGLGIWSREVAARAGDDYWFVLDEEAARPDPCSRFQQHGIHGPSQVVDTTRFDIAPRPELALEELVVYELHVGTFTREGTFDSAIPRLRGLRELGVTAIELMPVATFPGNRNWGYDGVYTFAPHPAYGGPDGLARLVDASHREGLAVVLDVVYNHVGPGAAAIAAFGPYFDERRAGDWGPPLDYSQRGVREWAIQNAELWTRDYDIDGLRLDAVAAVHDESQPHVLTELKQRVDALVISEMNRDDQRPLEEWGHDAMWLDNLHHELHVLLTGERRALYEQFGSIDGLVRELRRANAERFVVCAQNHDQIGNRAQGDRLPPDAHRVALACVLFSLYTPLMFMGEEYDDGNPFPFFTDHVDPLVADATCEGRKVDVLWATGTPGPQPDPQDERTFERAKLHPREPDPFYRELLALRRELPRELDVDAEGSRVTLRRGGTRLLLDFDRRAVELHRRRLDGAGQGAEVPAPPAPERETS